MARLTAEDLQNVRTRIEKAALNRFIRSGYNGVTMREIAEDAKVPAGSLYNHFADKQCLFKHLVTQQSELFLSPNGPLAQYLLQSNFPFDLELLAGSIARSTDRCYAYFKLMYVDVVEFEGRHIRNTFSNLELKFKDALQDRFSKLGLLGPDQSIEPAFAFVTIYLSFYQYFVLRKIFGATQIYDRTSESSAIKGMIHLYQHGIAR